MKGLFALSGSAVLGLALATGAFAGDGAKEDRAAILEIIAAVERGWETADGTPFRTHYHDFMGARYVEGGGQNNGLDDLIDHHVEPEGDALIGLDLTFTEIEVHIKKDFAWALADLEVEATVRKDMRDIHKRGYETFLFERIDGTWKVVHTHSSTRTVRK